MHNHTINKNTLIARNLQDFRADTPDQWAVHDFAYAYMHRILDGSGKGRCAFFSGGTGTGKTHLAIGIGLGLRSQGKSVFFTTMAQLIESVSAEDKDPDAFYEFGILEHLMKVDFLVINDFGLHKFGSLRDQGLWFEVMNDRYENWRPTVFTTTLGLNEIRECLGEYIESRMYYSGSEFIPFNWQSYRKQKGQP